MLPKTDKDIGIDRREVYRYLGYGRNTPDAGTAGMIDACIRDVIVNAELRYVAGRFPVVKSEVEGGLRIGDAEVTSGDLARNLKDCKEAYLMGVTIGIGVDRLIARATVTDVTKAAIYQAAGAAYIEAFCDYVNEEIKAIACREDMETRPRYSPGYGDLPLDYQKDIFRLLDLSKNVGISLTESRTMSPSKSVTAIIGLRRKGAPEERRASTTKCESCEQTDCRFRER